MSFFKKGDAGEPAGGGGGQSFSETERRTMYIIATAVLLVLALIYGALSGSGSGSCKGILLQGQRDACFSSLAISTNSASTCNGIASERLQTSCIEYIAKAQRNVSLCGEIGRASAAYSECVLNVSASTGNESYCQLLNGTYRTSCLWDFAEASGFGGTGSCYNMTNASTKNECLDMHYYNSALNSNSSHYCSMLPNTVNSTVLSTMLNEGAGNATSFEMQAAAYAINDTPEDYCYYSIATRSGNRSVCSLATGMLGALCNSTFTYANSTPSAIDTSSLCSAAPSDFRIICTSNFLTSQAIGSKNISKCLQISQMPYQYACITSYAEKYNESYCSYIGNSTMRDECQTSAIMGANRTT